MDSCLQFALHRLKSWAVNSCATSQRVQVLKLDRKIVESHMCLRLLRFSKSSYKLKHQVDKRIFAFLSLLASVNPLTGLLCYCWWSKLSHYSHSVTTYTLNKIFESAVAVGGLISLTGLCSGQFIWKVSERQSPFRAKYIDDSGIHNFLYIYNSKGQGSFFFMGIKILISKLYFRRGRYSETYLSLLL